eukprot:TRINITY_DN3952_c0_g1_i2.p1 TRINITY_DN3952_c0_g1~~TRINITY_DN3952_c0_g1_i2.p1  ORF type:complete len:765 (-),score=147.43 TRINITY_DN3952_c0_g1_i2:128-2422(-)
MTSIVKFTALCGAQTEDPLSYLLEIDDFLILLDCGWNDQFDTKLLEPLRKVADKIDAVLISHPDVYHLGALPYAFSKLGLKAPVYGTIPVFKMGQMFLYDVFQSRHCNEDFTLFNLDDVDSAFENWRQLKFSQHLALEGKGVGIVITPYAAGHQIGGTVWKITKESDEIVYAVDYNHKKERHLNGTILETLTRPTLLITDAFNAFNQQNTRKLRDNELLEDIVRVLRSGNSVLLPTDTAGRVLELVLILEQHWAQHWNLGTYSVALLTHVSSNTIEFAKSQLEWMGDTIMQAFDSQRENPFALKNVKLCHNMLEFNILPKPVVVLASPATLGYGYARDLFIEMTSNPGNLILFTDRGLPNSMARYLLNNPTPEMVNVKIGKRVPLEGEELIQYERTQRELKEKQEEQKRREAEEEERRRKKRALAEKKALLERGKVEGEEEDVEMDEAGVEDGELVEDELKEEDKNPFVNNRFDMTPMQFTQERLGFPIFPFVEKHLEWDEYGEKDELYMKMAEAASEGGDEENKQDQGSKQGPINNDTKAIEEDLKKPSKCIVNTVNVKIKAPVKYIDFEGRSDGRSIKTIITHIKPRKLILIHGTPEAISHLQQHCEKSLKNDCKAILSPKLGETVDLTNDISIYKIKLKDTLLESLEYVNSGAIGEYELAYVDGILTNTFGAVPSLDLVPSKVVKGHNAVYVGDIKLSDFKDVLTKNGFHVQFNRGVLTANGCVALRREEVNGAFRVCIDGVVSEDYYRVRKLLYDQYIIL